MIRRLVGSVAALLLTATMAVATVQPASAAKSVSTNQKAVATVVGKYFDAIFYPDEAATNTLLAAKDAATPAQYEAAYPALGVLLDTPDAPWATLKPYYDVAAEFSADLVSSFGSPRAPLAMGMKANAEQVVVTGSTAVVYGDALVMTMLGMRTSAATDRDAAALFFAFVRTAAGWKVDTRASRRAGVAVYDGGVPVVVQKKVATTSDLTLYGTYPSKQKLGVIPAGTKVTVFHTYGSGTGFVAAAKVRVGKKTVRNLYGFARVPDTSKTQRTTIKGWPAKVVAHGSKPAVVKISTNRKKAAVQLQAKHGSSWATVGKVRTTGSGKATVKVPAKVGKYRLVVKKAKGFAAATSETLTLRVAR